jgi:RNA recognition motif-containing protein
MADASQRTVFVTNLNYKTEGQTLGKEFERFGAIGAVRIITYTGYRGDQLSRGFGFIEFRTDDGYRKAIENTDPVTVDGRQLSIRASRPRQVRKRDTAFIAGIPEGTTGDQLKQIFAKYHPTEVRIVKTAPAGTFGGFAFVTFETEEDQTAAVAENRNIKINGVDSVVRYARPPGRFNNRGGGRFQRRPFPRRAQRDGGPSRPATTPREGAPPPAGDGAATDRPKRARKPRKPREPKPGDAGPASDTK